MKMFYKLISTLLIFIFLQAGVTFAFSGTQSARALEIQAAFLVKFCSYVKWPPRAFSKPDDPLIIGILGQDPFGSTIDEITRFLTVNGRGIEVKRFKDFTVLQKCHILFISDTVAGQIDDALKILAGQPVLLVGNFPGFLEHSGIINFIPIGNKIRFNISRANCSKMGLEISSKLLAVAHVIK